MTRRRPLPSLVAAIVAATGAVAAEASELSYTYVDFQAFSAESDLSGSQVPVPGQTVAVQTQEGDGISIGGSMSLGERFYIGGRFQTSIIDVGAVVTNPFGVTRANDNFDLIQSRLAFGYYRELAENFDITVDVSLDSTEYDFGSFAGENFDMRDEGVGVRAGFRWNPIAPFELYGYAHHSPVGKADLTLSTFEPDTSVAVGAMWYFFEDLGIGVDYVTGDIESVSFSMRFSFGDLALRR